MQGRTVRILFVFSFSSLAQTSIILPHPPVHAVPKPFVHPDRDCVRTAHVEIDEVSLVPMIRYMLEHVHHFARQRQPAVLRRDRDGCDVAVPLTSSALRLSEYCDRCLVGSCVARSQKRAHHNSSSVRSVPLVRSRGPAISRGNSNRNYCRTAKGNMLAFYGFARSSMSHRLCPYVQIASPLQWSFTAISRVTYMLLNLNKSVARNGRVTLMISFGEAVEECKEGKARCHLHAWIFDRRP